jgi:YceI-like domain
MSHPVTDSAASVGPFCSPHKLLLRAHATEPSISNSFYLIRRRPIRSLDCKACHDGRKVAGKVRFAVEGPAPPAKDLRGNTRIGLSASTKINRKDFGLTWNTALEIGGILVGDDITITLDAQFVKA